MGKLDSQNGTVRTGQEEQDRQNRTFFINEDH
jgi:hypothetical protein